MARVLDSGLTVYFHNLRFDGNFIIYWAFAHGYQHVELDSSRDSLPDGHFSCMIDDMGAFYGIRFPHCDFRDSLKKLPMSIEQMAKAFEAPSPKGAIDYEAPRGAGYSPTVEEWEYVRTDVEILAHAMTDILEHGMTALTVSSDALKEYRGIIGFKTFNKYFPELDSVRDAEIRRAYRGGFTYADTRTAGELVGEGSVYDVNSLYPFVMRERVLPFGEPERFGGAPSDSSRLWTVTVTFTAELRDGFLPCIQVRNGFRWNPSEYLSVIDEPVTMTVTSVDWALWNEHYDISVWSWDGGYYFNGTRGLFDEYVDKWMSVKAESTGGRRTMAKLFLNSLYGKFGTSTDATGRVPYLGDDGVVHYTKGRERERKPVYTAVAVFVTAWARDYTIRTAQKNYDRFLYADTDSMHLLGADDPVGADVHPSRLGAWKRECVFERAVFNRAKQYSEYYDGRNDTHIAGLPVKVARTIAPEDMLRDHVWGGKLVPRRTVGGVVLREISFTYAAVRRRQ